MRNGTYQLMFIGRVYYSYKVQILDKVVWISNSANTLGKGINPTILPPTIGK